MLTIMYLLSLPLTTIMLLLLPLRENRAGIASTVLPLFHFRLPRQDAVVLFRGDGSLLVAAGEGQARLIQLFDD